MKYLLLDRGYPHDGAFYLSENFWRNRGKNWLNFHDLVVRGNPDLALGLRVNNWIETLWTKDCAEAHRWTDTQDQRNQLEGVTMMLAMLTPCNCTTIRVVEINDGPTILKVI